MLSRVALEESDRLREAREMRFDRLFMRARRLLPEMEMQDAAWLHWRFWCPGTVAQACASFMEAVALLANTMEMSALCVLELNTGLRAVVDELDLIDGMEGRVKRIGRRVIAQMRMEERP